MLKRLSLSIGLALIAGCADGALAPVGYPPGPTYARGAVTDRGEGVFTTSGTTYFACLGEDVRFTITVPITYTRVVTPSGNRVLVDPFIPNSGTGTLVGVSSGTVWTMERVVAPEVIIVNSGSVTHITASAWWRSADGRVLHEYNVIHFQLDAAGNVIADRFTPKCNVK